MKKFLSFLMIAMLLAACCTAASAASYLYFTGSANVRTGPGLGYSSIGQVREGSSLEYAGADYDSRGVCWYKVPFDGGYGWVSSKNATLTGFDGMTVYASGGSGNGFSNTDYASGGFVSGTVTATGRLNVRSGPGLDHAVLDTMQKDESAAYLGNSSYDSRGMCWYCVQFGEHTGWVSSAYVTLTLNSGFGFGFENFGGAVTATDGNSNLRTGPGLGYQSIGYLQEGETASYLGSSSVDERGVTWYKINFNGQTGWVSSKYTTLAN